MTVDEALGLAARYRARAGILVDTNLLLLLLVGRVDSNAIASNDRTSTFELIDYWLLSELIGPDPRLVLTPQIATEVSNLGAQLFTGKRRDECVALTKELFLVAAERREETRRIVEDPAFDRLGLTDAAIAKLKRRSPLVITADHNLHVALIERDVPTINFHHLRPELLGMPL